MNYKDTNAPTTTVTYNKDVIEAPTENIYEAISIIAKEKGIHVASSFARHSDIRITSDVYAEQRVRSEVDTLSLFQD